jgi:hypothetical protein
VVRSKCQNGRGSGKAQGKAPFIVLPMVHSFDFRVLRQNRRVVQDEARRQEIENFHNVLTDISYCECTPAVREFIVNAYVRGAQVGGGSSEHCPFEGNTAVFTKRRYRDAWNRAVTRRLSRVHNHSLKIKARTWLWFWAGSGVQTGRHADKTER